MTCHKFALKTDVYDVDAIAREQEACMLEWLSKNTDGEWPDSARAVLDAFTQRRAKR
jgi:hypothetical protein